MRQRLGELLRPLPHMVGVGHAHPRDEVARQRRHTPHQSRKAGAGVGAVRAAVLRGEPHHPHPLVHGRTDLREDVLLRERVQAAAGEHRLAEGAASEAAPADGDDLHGGVAAALRQKQARRGGGAAGQRGPPAGERALNHLHDGGDVVRPHLRVRGEFPRLLRHARHAPREDQHRPPPRARRRKLAHAPAEIQVGAVLHRAAVHDHRVGRVGRVGDDVAGALQQARHHLAVGRVEGAPVGLDVHAGAHGEW